MWDQCHDIVLFCCWTNVKLTAVFTIALLINSTPSRIVSAAPQNICIHRIGGSFLKSFIQMILNNTRISSVTDSRNEAPMWILSNPSKCDVMMQSLLWSFLKNSSFSKNEIWSSWILVSIALEITRKVLCSNLHVKLLFAKSRHMLSKSVQSCSKFSLPIGRCRSYPQMAIYKDQSHQSKT